MAIASANSVVFDFYAACQINGDGTGKKTFGCDIVRVAPGLYEFRLPAESGLSSEDTYLAVTPRALDLILASVGSPTVVDTSPFIKTIVMRLTDGTIGDQGFTAVLLRPTTSPAV